MRVRFIFVYNILKMIPFYNCSNEKIIPLLSDSIPLDSIPLPSDSIPLPADSIPLDSIPLPSDGIPVPSDYILYTNPAKRNMLQPVNEVYKSYLYVYCGYCCMILIF